MSLSCSPMQLRVVPQTGVLSHLALLYVNSKSADSLGHLYGRISSFVMCYIDRIIDMHATYNYFKTLASHCS